MVNKFIAKLFSRKFGQDEFGNEYRIGYAKNYLGQNKRFVIYNGLDLPCKVPPGWHAWLHYLTNDLPTITKKLDWEREFEPNLTGTKHAREP